MASARVPRVDEVRAPVLAAVGRHGVTTPRQEDAKTNLVLNVRRILEGRCATTPRRDLIRGI